MREEFIIASIRGRIPKSGKTSTSRYIVKHQKFITKYRRRERLGRAFSTVCPRMFSVGVFASEIAFKPRGTSAVITLAMILVLVSIGILVFIVGELRAEKMKQ